MTTLRKLILVLMGLLIANTLSLAMISETHADTSLSCYTASDSESYDRYDVISAVNDLRRSRGLRNLAENIELSRAAYKYSILVDTGKSAVEHIALRYYYDDLYHPYLPTPSPDAYVRNYDDNVYVYVGHPHYDHYAPTYFIDHGTTYDEVNSEVVNTLPPNELVESFAALRSGYSDSIVSSDASSIGVAIHNGIVVIYIGD